jgi:hypothetical protein
VQGYNDNMIGSIWRSIESTLCSMVYDGSMEDNVASQLLGGRDSMGFDTMMARSN